LWRWVLCVCQSLVLICVNDILYVYRHSRDLICSKCVSLWSVDGTGRALSIWSVSGARGVERTEVADVHSSCQVWSEREWRGVMQIANKYRLKGQCLRSLLLLRSLICYFMQSAVVVIMIWVETQFWMFLIVFDKHFKQRKICLFCN
jgi:hypothetical protein